MQHKLHALSPIEKSPIVDSLGLQIVSSYGHNAINYLDSWHGFLIGGGAIVNLNIFRWDWMKLAFGLHALGEFYFLPLGQKPYYLGKDGYLSLFSLRLESKLRFYPIDFLYFGPGTLFSLSLIGALGDKDRGAVRIYKPFLVPFVTFHVGYRHRQLLFKLFRWSIEIDGKFTLNNETHFELGAQIIFAYQFKK